MHLFRPPSGFVVCFDPKDRGGGGRFADYRFDLSRVLKPQFERARRHLLAVQQEVHGPKHTPKPRKDNWRLFLRAIDARDCGATYAQMARAFWPQQEKTEQSARDIFCAAVRLRENFPG